MICVTCRKKAKKWFHKGLKTAILKGMDHKGFSRVGALLPAVLKSVGLDKRFKERRLLALWPAVVGEEIASRTEAVKVERGLLYVHVTHSVWMQELHFMEKEIYKKLQTAAPDVEFDGIRFGARKLDTPKGAK